MHAILLAAGIGKRIGAAAEGKPKSLLDMGGASLLARHLRELAACGVGRVTIVTGWRAELIHIEAGRAGVASQASFLHNPHYEQGSVVSLWCAREILAGGEPVLLMDADVLYAPAILRRLCATRHANCFLLDRDFVPGEEPVKLCLRGGRIVEFRKTLAPDLACDIIGESVGFFRFAPAMAARLAHQTQRYLDDGRRDEPYEEALRDLLLEMPAEFGCEDVTGLPWLEIDFPDDVARARRDILPRLAGAQHA
jgi:choline kinase